MPALKQWLHEWATTLRVGSPLTKAGRDLRRSLRDPFDGGHYVEVDEPL